MNRGTTKPDLLTKPLAAILLDIPVGDRIPTVRDLASTLEASTGSVQGALSLLVSHDAIQLNHRGHLGTFLTNRDPARLWQVAQKTPVVIALPLSRTRRFEGLATALKKALTSAGLDAYLMFMAGSRQRLSTLRSGSCRMAVMSRWAADELTTDDEYKLLTLPPGTYVGAHRVYTSLDRRTSGRPRVIIDQHSADQQLLTQLEFGDQDVEYVPATYMQFGNLLESGAADSVLWSSDEIPPHIEDKLSSRPLSPGVASTLQERDTQASLVGLRTQYEIDSALAHVLDVEVLLDTQQQVLDGLVLPEY